ncbi:MAG: hypothetical protein K6T75_01630 [Acetobacteraceae bacterium]|nr:hypothetical protein [Acetobacteraceae bacterium]
MLSPEGEGPERRPYWYLSSRRVVGDSSGFSFQIPPAYYLLVAVDPASEAALTRLDQHLTWGSYLRPAPLQQVVVEQVLDDRGRPRDVNAYEIPVVVNTATPVPYQVELLVDRLRVAEEQLDALPLGPAGRPDKAALLALAQSAPALESRRWTYDLSRFLRPFQTISLNVAGDGTAQPTLDAYSQTAPASQYFVSRGISYDILSRGTNIVLRPVPRGERDGQVLFHELIPQGKPYLERVEAGEDVFVLRPVGGLSFAGPAQDELARSPLGIYGPEELLLTADAAGQPRVPPVPLTPTGTPGTIHVPGAHGLTTLEAARLLKGGAPIDAIRVRVKGSGPYDAALEQRVRRVAEQIAISSGLRVDIVAGASPREAALVVPGFGGVAPLGSARCQLTSLGAAAQIRSTFEWLALALAIAFAGAAAGFCANRGRLLLEQRRNELLTLAWQGWSRHHLGAAVAGEAAALWCLAGVASALCVWLGPFEAGAPAVWGLVFALGGTAFCGTTGILAARQPGTAASGAAAPSGSLPGSGRPLDGAGSARAGRSGPRARAARPRGLLRADVFHYGRQLIPVGAQLALGCGLCVLATLLWSVAAGRASVTRLGAYVAAASAPYLVVVAAASGLVAALTCIDAVTAHLEARRDHFQLLNDNGWSWGRISLVAVVESVMPALGGALCGAGMAALCVRAIEAEAGLPWLVPLAALAGLPAVAAAAAGWWLSTLGRSARAALRRRVALAGAATAAAACLIAAAFLIPGQRPPQAAASGPGPEAVTLDAGAAGVEAHDIVRRLCAAGNRPNGSDADRAEVELICQELQRTGLEPRRETVDVPPLLVVSPGATLTAGGARLEFNFLAVDLVRLGPRRGHTIADPRPVVWPAGGVGEGLAGRVVLVEAEDLRSFAAEVERIMPGCPAAVLGLGPGEAAGAAAPLELHLDVLEMLPAYRTEAVAVDVPGVEAGRPALWVVSSHGAAGGGAQESAGEAAVALVVARHMARKPPPGPVRFVWLPACAGQLALGAVEYVSHRPPPAALVLDGLGGPSPLLFGKRSDIAFGRPFASFEAATDLAPEDYVRLTPQAKWLNGVLDLGRPGTLRIDLPDTPDDWMATANRLAYAMGLDLRPGMGFGIANQVRKFCPRVAELWRDAPYTNTLKDTPDRVDPATLGGDAAFADALIRTLLGREKE